MNPTTTLRIASRAALRPVPRQIPSQLARRQVISRRGYASDAGNAAQGQGVVLAALAALGVGGYFYLKPVRDVASKMNATMEKAQEYAQAAQDKAADVSKAATDAASQAGQKAVEVGKKAATEAVSGDGDILSVASSLAKEYLPHVATAVTGGGIGGLLYKLKDSDLTAALETLKKTGNDQVTRVVDIVQAKLKAADNKVENIDWKELVHELNEELGGKYKSTIDTLIGKVPSADDFEDMAKKLKEEGKDKLKGVEDAASKIYKNIEAATKDKKLSADAFVEGIKKSKGEDLDELAKSIKGLLKDAGLPADAVVDYARDKAKDGADYAEEYAKDVQAAFDKAAKWLPVDEETAVKTASSISPSLGKMVKELLNEMHQQADKAKDTIEKGKEVVKDKAGKK